MPDYAIYFSSYFFDTIPDRNYTNASSVPRDECKISCFWKNNDDLLSKPSSVLQYQHSVLYHYQTSIIQFHFIPVIKTARQPFNHHTFCTPLTRHQHCSVNMVFTTPIIQFSTAIAFKILLYPQNLFKTDFNLIYIVIENHSILPYRSPIPLFHHSNSIPSFQHSKGHQKRRFVLIVSLFQLIFFQFYQQHSPPHNFKTSTIT